MAKIRKKNSKKSPQKNIFKIFNEHIEKPCVVPGPECESGRAHRLCQDLEFKWGFGPFVRGLRWLGKQNGLMRREIRSAVAGETPNLIFVKPDLPGRKTDLADEPLFYIGAEGRSAHTEDFHGLPGSDQMAVRSRRLPEIAENAFNLVLCQRPVRYEY